MSGLEIALIILVAIWSVIFLIIAVSLIYIFWQAKKGIGKFNKILENFESITGNIATPLSKAITGATLLKQAFNSVIIHKSKPKKVGVIKK